MESLAGNTYQCIDAPRYHSWGKKLLAQREHVCTLGLCRNAIATHLLLMNKLKQSLQPSALLPHSFRVWSGTCVVFCLCWVSHDLPVFLRLLQFPPTSQKHCKRANETLNLPCMLPRDGLALHPGCIPTYAPGISSRSVLTEKKSMNKCRIHIFGVRKKIHRIVSYCKYNSSMSF